MAHDFVPPEVKKQLEQIGAAHVVLGVPRTQAPETARPIVDTVREAVDRLSPTLKTVVLLPDDGSRHDPTDTADALDSRVAAVVCPLAPIHRFPLITRDAQRPLSLLRAVCANVGARVCAVVGSDSASVSADTVRLLLQPVLVSDHDLVMPRYAMQTFDGLINTGIVYPFTRALYGKRVRGQIGVDFGFSSRFLERVAQHGAGRRPLWFATDAATSGMRVCQANLGIRLPPSDEHIDLSTALAQV
ncbi:MAG: hypothetical protein ACRD1H_19140, partial [Vicinamibacterales bacterium]